MSQTRSPALSPSTMDLYIFRCGGATRVPGCRTERCARFYAHSSALVRYLQGGERWILALHARFANATLKRTCHLVRERIVAVRYAVTAVAE